MFRRFNVHGNEIITSSTNTVHRTAASQGNTSATGRAVVSGNYENWKLHAGATDSIASAASGMESVSRRVENSEVVANKAEKKTDHVLKGSVIRVMRKSTKTTERTSKRQ